MSDTSAHTNESARRMDTLATDVVPGSVPVLEPGLDTNFKPDSAADLARGTGQKVSALLAQAITALDDATLILHADGKSLIWSSPAVQRLIPAFSSDGAQAVLHRMQPALPELLQQSACKERGAGGTLNSILVAVDDSPRLECTVCVLADGGVVLRLKDTRDHFMQLQNYMEEREKLFTTSRTISVSEMATTLAHELNQPIGTVANILKGVKTRLSNLPDDAKLVSEKKLDILTALDRAVDQSQFAARIISRIRDFTQARQPSKVSCDIYALLEQSADLLDWVVDKAEVEVACIAPDESVFVSGDPTMLQQVFTNLIRNAVDSMREVEPSQRKLRLSVRLKEGDAQIEIADSGHGLSKSAEKNLFVPFVTQKSRGMGVGLNICRSFVELHQGRLWLAQNESGGCTSFVVLPVEKS